MTIELDLQRVSSCDSVPDDENFRLWAQTALEGQGSQHLTIRIVDHEESAALNSRYRSRHGPTNVLSFPVELPEVVDLPLLGDIVICAPLVEAEAKEQGKAVQAHWAHLVIHGILHLLGMDHQSDNDAREMESREITLLERLGLPDPYN